jgi:hypothetical protein
MLGTITRRRHLKRYSIISIIFCLTLCYVFAFLQNAWTMLRSIVANIFLNRSGYIGAVTASFSYSSKLIDQHYCFYSLPLHHYKLSAFPLLQFHWLKKDIKSFYFKYFWTASKVARPGFQRFSENVTLQIALYDNALTQWRKVIAS